MLTLQRAALVPARRRRRASTDQGAGMAQPDHDDDAMEAILTEPYQVFLGKEKKKE
mgnify:CR=1 FL=1